MRCYSCNVVVSHNELDTQTGRYYCSPCFEPTNEEILQSGKKTRKRSSFTYSEEPVLDTMFDDGWSEEKINDTLKELGFDPEEFELGDSNAGAY